MHSTEEYVAVFDSGIGGVSVLRELIRHMPREKFLYFGDSANAPYGERPLEQVRELTVNAVEKLLARSVKAVVIACNTATAAAAQTLREMHPEEIIVGIEPAVKVAAGLPEARHVGVMATPVTLRLEKYHHLLEQFPGLEVSPISVPNLVPMIEAGVSSQLLESYLRPVLEQYAGKLDALVLGCTHYPFAAPVIRKILGDGVRLVDGSVGVARETMRRLERAGLLHSGPGELVMENSASDPRILERAKRLLEENLYAIG